MSDDIVEDLQLAIDYNSEDSVFIQGAIDEINRLRTALLEISQLTPGLWKTPEYHYLSVSNIFNEAKRIAAEALQSGEPLV